ncbi:hypothetical protein SBDP1_420013 [Syntrophobacter sp. SbD1]|nr:hypothetical protein SBDP1_420013 [Syntrophobacter sp. SbD1]
MQVIRQKVLVTKQVKKADNRKEPLKGEYNENNN